MIAEVLPIVGFHQPTLNILESAFHPFETLDRGLLVARAIELPTGMVSGQIVTEPV